MKEEAVDCNMWRDRFGRGFELVVRLVDDDNWVIYRIKYCVRKTFPARKKPTGSQ